MSDWMDIESAPRDGKILLARPDSHVSIGRFDDQRYHQQPKPRFTGHCKGKIWEAANQPTHWMPLPPPPTGEKI